MQKVLVNRLVNFPRKKVWLGDYDPVAVDWDVKHQTKQAKPIVPSSVNTGRD